MLKPKEFITLPRIREIEFYFLSQDTLLNKIYNILNQKYIQAKSLTSFLRGLNEHQQAFFILWSHAQAQSESEWDNYVSEALAFLHIQLSENASLTTILEGIIREKPFLFCHPGGGRQFEPYFTGTVCSYFDAEHIHESLTIEKGLAQGAYIERNFQQQVQKTIFFEQGKKTKGTFFSPEYEKIEVVYTETLEQRYYYLHGQIVRFEQWDSQQRKQGVYQEWYEDGTLKLEMNFEKGIAEGAYQIYDRERKLQQSGIYVQGLAYLWTYINPAGESVLTQGTGMVIEESYTSHGDLLRYETPFYEGLKQGIQKIYKNNVLEIEQAFEQGKKISTSTQKKKKKG